MRPIYNEKHEEKLKPDAEIWSSPIVFAIPHDLPAGGTWAANSSTIYNWSSSLGNVGGRRGY